MTGALAEQQIQEVTVPRRLKISSKRQITIPTDVYKRHGFSDYAMLEETDGGLVIRPVKLADDNEELTLNLLRYLMGKGLEGEELLAKYEELKPKFVSFYRAIDQAEADIDAGHVVDFDAMQQELEKKYGL